MSTEETRSGGALDAVPSPSRVARGLDGAVVAVAALLVTVTLAGPALQFGFGRVTLPGTTPLLAAAAGLWLVRRLADRRTSSADTWRVWRRQLDAYPHAAAALRAFVPTRIAVFVVSYFAVVTFGLAPSAGFTLSSDPFANLPARFDAGWYGSIALDGYHWDRQFTRQRNIAFFPAMPMLMKVAGRLNGAKAPGLPRERRMLRILWAGVFISLAAFFLALVYLSRLTELLAGPAAAAAAPLLLATYPFAVFFNAPYTEGLFLLGTIGAFYHFHREQWVRAALFGLLVGLSRPNGCLLSIPLAVLAAQKLFGSWRATERPPAARVLGRAALPSLLTAAMPGIGMLLFTVYLFRLTGVWFAWARMQEAWGRTWGTRPMAQGWEWLTTEGLMAVTRGVPADTMNTLAVLFVAALLWPVLKRLGLAYALFVLVNLVPPVFAGGALSMGRISSTLFPVFIVLAARLPPQAVAPWAAGFAVSQGLVAALFFTWRELF